MTVAVVSSNRRDSHNPRILIDAPIRSYQKAYQEGRYCDKAQCAWRLLWSECLCSPKSIGNLTTPPSPPGNGIKRWGHWEKLGS